MIHGQDCLFRRGFDRRKCVHTLRRSVVLKDTYPLPHILFLIRRRFSVDLPLGKIALEEKCILFLLSCMQYVWTAKKKTDRSRHLEPGVGLGDSIGSLVYLGISQPAINNTWLDQNRNSVYSYLRLRLRLLRLLGSTW